MRTSALISTDQALKLINEENAVVLDSTIDKVNQKMDSSKLELIPNSLFFDIEGVFSDHESSFPHTMVSPEKFSAEAKKLGINQGSTVIVYDRWGVYSSPRAWWMFRYMGLEKVYVLNGGEPAWKAAGLPIVDEYGDPESLGNFKAKPNYEWFISKEELEERLGDDDFTITDARSAGRFHGTAPEPREGLRSGHIPNSKNLPFDQVLDGITYHDPMELEKLYEGKIDSGKQNIFTCGSGISAAIIALGAYELGNDYITIYDGSWSEWGADPDSAVVKD
ncbi:sulfurtransferase [Sphingobacterium endophyticum]|uniref:sulfurtransferase n=1 Tax=Sphingobacterium endophyticum TaxID=2546448 RepID=UPI0012E130BC|nr:sulfurtransferase [Sphingobacterium endophyticum]